MSVLRKINGHPLLCARVCDAVWMEIQLKLGGGYFEHRAFAAELMKQRDDNSFHLEQIMKGWYYLPFKEKQDTSDWWKMDNEKREKVLGPDLRLQADVKEIEDGVEIRLNVTGVKKAPFRIEAAVTGASFIRGSQFDLKTEPGRTMILKDKLTLNLLCMPG